MHFSGSKLPSSIIYLLSPADRLFFTFTPDTLREAFGVESDKPLFVFGKGRVNQEVIDSTEKAVASVDLKTEGVHLVDPTTLNFNTLLNHSIQSGALEIKGEYANTPEALSNKFMLERDLLASINQPKNEQQLWNPSL